MAMLAKHPGKMPGRITGANQTEIHTISLGKDALFNDRFSGASGIYFYEQSPHHQTPQNHQSQKMGGVWDAVLKVFGI